MKVVRDYYVTDAELKTALKVLKDRAFYDGEQEEKLEKEYCDQFHTKYAVAVSSATAALHCAMLALKVGHGDEVIAPANTDRSILHAIMHVGANPVFCDVEEDTMTLDPSQIRQNVTSNTKAVIVVSTAGHPTEFRPVLDIAETHGLTVVNDSAQALGSKYLGKFCDSFGDLTVSSFGQSKHLSAAGRLGIISTNKEELAEAVHMYSHQGEGRSYRRHSIQKCIRPSFPILDRSGLDIPGYRYEPSELHCAIARAQLRRFMNGPLGPEKRRRNAGYYSKALSILDPAVKTPVERSWAYHTYCHYMIRAKNRNELLTYLVRRNIQAHIHYPVPLHHFKMFSDRWGTCRGVLPVTEKLSKEVLTLPCWPTLTGRQLKYVVASVKEFYKRNDP